MRLPFGYSEISEADVALLDPSPAERVRFRLESNPKAWLADIDEALEAEGFRRVRRCIAGDQSSDFIQSVWMREDEEIEVRNDLDSANVAIIFTELGTLYI